MLLRLGDLVVLASPLDILPEANARTLALHHDVVATTLDAAAVVPLRFGTVVATADLDAWLGAHAQLVRATLGQLVAFLVPRAEVGSFLTRIAPIASRSPGIAVVPTGPWPPYSFVPTFDRFPLARLSGPDRGAGRLAC